MLLSALLPLILGSTVFGKTIQCNVFNKCPKEIVVDFSEKQFSDHNIPLAAMTGSKVININADVSFIGTRASESDDLGSLVTGFFDDFYFVAASSTHFSVGVQVKPSVTSANGFCETVECDGPGCPEASVSLLLEKDFPAPSESPPSPPFYRCPENDAFDITFCPNGQFPGHEGRPIQFDSSDGQTKCLDVQDGVLNNGTLVQINDCNGSGTQRWIISDERVQLAGTNYCLDAGTDAANGNQLKIWGCCDPALPAQQWVYTTDHRITLEGQEFCMDVENGTPTNGNKVQTWQCTDFDTNQIWRSEIPEE